MSNLIEKIFPNKIKPKEIVQQVKPKWQVEIEERQAKRATRKAERATREAENLAASKAAYQNLIELLQSGDAVELTGVWVHFMSGAGLELLLDDKSLSLLRDLMESEQVGTIRFSALRYMATPIVVRLRSDALCYVSEHSGGRWIAVNEVVHRVPQEDVVRFAQEDKAECQ